MRHAASQAAAPALAPAPRLAAETDKQPGSWIRLRLALASAQVHALRQSLHRAIGGLARVYVVEVDHRHGLATLHVEVARGGRDAAMHAIMAALPEAEFGVTTALEPDHVAH
ncbi:hypothetical protein BKK79_14025 [Cupriavidus sp. USMAA2-4]|uniref:Uncharacterized protein n=1 Tax=Cupriavidus malaysiensis TaxID=367825 RepID=A0ABN4TKT4_9BURK|nr:MULTISPECIES: hypothetical protein [Cupriavidus]AOY92769.1 hypothetical protein BKK79_14025 [Cupriavidus sp. USMAA2-4]AOZ00761.1 hypothetical protein BKK81_17035 [Cupriavidus sp. USMAHM13]AOZ07518.1 hypothetical protein BKK80_18040 [Cupriavidus malaysiensis]